MQGAEMNRRQIATWAGATGIALFIMAGPSPAGASTPPTTNVVRSEQITRAQTNPPDEQVGGVIPGPCTDCSNHNQRPGNGPGIYTVLHACDTVTGEGIDAFFLGNPTSSPVPYTLHSYAGKVDGDQVGDVQATFTGIIPAAVGKKAGSAVFDAKDIDKNGYIVIAGTIGSRVKPPEQFNCPCVTPGTPTTTVPTSPPSSTVTTPASSVPGTTPAGTATTIPHGGPVPAGTLPATGSDSMLYFAIGFLAVLLGGFIVSVTRRKAH
jgi:LPXTG-motif cell wall-anchored protein